MTTVTVRPAPGLTVPREGGGRSFSSEPTEVPLTPYVARRLRAGELLEVKTPTPPRRPAPSKEA